MSEAAIQYISYSDKGPSAMRAQISIIWESENRKKIPFSGHGASRNLREEAQILKRKKMLVSHFTMYFKIICCNNVYNFLYQ